MTSQSTLPSTRDQAQHALLLLGAPAPARLVVDVHAALFDGDLDMPSLVALLRAEQLALVRAEQLALVHAEQLALVHAEQCGTEVAAGSTEAYKICVGLGLDLSAARGMLALAAWPVARRIVTPANARADELAMVVRVAEFVAIRAGGGSSVLGLMRQLAELVPNGPESVSATDPGALAQAARSALAEPALAEAVEREEPARAEAAARAEQLERTFQLFGVPALPKQRGHK